MLQKLFPAVSAVVLTATGFAFAEMGTPEPTVVEETTTTVADGATTTTLADGDVTTTTVADGTVTTTTVLSGDGTGVERSYEGCGDFTEGNHGDYVSGIAKTKPHEPGAVPEAAHSNCGKPVGSVEGDESEDDSTTETTLGTEAEEVESDDDAEDDEDTAAEDGDQGNSGQGNGQGNGKGRH